MKFLGALKAALSRRLPTASLRHFIGNERGNIAVITALCALPMLAAIGCMIDYGSASMVRTKLLAAADAAALATVSINSPVIASAKTNSSVASGKSYANNFFAADATSIIKTFNLSLKETSAVTMTGRKVNATVSFTGTVPTYFLGLIGIKTIALNGSSTASYTLPTYIDFYLMLDVSGSMGMPSTSSEQTRLQSVNPDNLGSYPSGCTFACHFTAQGSCSQSAQGPIPLVGSATNRSPGGYCQGYTISRLGTSPANIYSGNNVTDGIYVNWNNTPVSSCPQPGTTSCIQLRLDAVGYAVSALLSEAATTETNTSTPNEFRVGLYPFIQNLCYANAGGSNNCSIGLTTSITGSTITDFATQLASLLDTGANSTLGSGGTHFENALSTMEQSVIPSSGGTGTAGSPLPYLFIVTDGSQDYQTQWGGGWGSQNWSSNSTVPYQNSATTMPPNSIDSTDYCGQLKANGVTIAVLYIPYQTIQNANASFASNEDGYANNNIPHIPAALQACASPNFFFTASSPTDIQNALLTMFQQSLSTAHIAQ